MILLTFFEITNELNEDVDIGKKMLNKIVEKNVKKYLNKLRLSINEQRKK